MGKFFSKAGNIEFDIFGNIHILMLVSTALAVILLIFFKDKLKQFKYKEHVRYIMAGILFLNMLVYYVSLIIIGEMDFINDLPLHLCFVTNFFMMYILVTGNKKLYKIIYFFTFIGPLPAMIWSDLTVSYDRYTFYQFIISHHIMFLTSLYLLLVLEYKVEKKYIMYAVIFGNLYVGLMALLNNIIGSNYVMLTSLPNTIQNIYPWVNYMPAIFWLEIVGILAVCVSYVPAYIVNNKKLNKSTI